MVEFLDLLDRKMNAKLIALMEFLEEKDAEDSAGRDKACKGQT